VASAPHRVPDIAEHPDMMEMRERYRRILDSGSAVAVDGLVLLSGLYLAVSPWLVGFSRYAPRLTVVDLILGLTVAVIGLALAARPMAMYRLSWAMVGIGVWALIAPWVTSSTMRTGRLVASNVITGAVTILLGLIAVAMLFSAARRSHSGGERGTPDRGEADRGATGR
jgi:hypothetical protein